MIFLDSEEESYGENGFYSDSEYDVEYDEAAPLTDQLMRYNQNAADLCITEFTVPPDMDKSILEKIEIENSFWQISEETVDELAVRLRQYILKKNTNQLFVIQLFDSVALAKPKLVKPLGTLLSKVIDLIPIDSNLIWESSYLERYLASINLLVDKKVSYARSGRKYSEYLYHRRSFEYCAVWDDLELFQELELQDTTHELDYKSYLKLAAQFASVNVFKYLVNSVKIDIDQEVFNNAVVGGDLFIVRYCLKYNKKPQDPLDNAVKCNNLQLVEWLISEYNILPSFFAPLQRHTSTFFMAMLPRAKYVPAIYMSATIVAALKSGYDEIAMYLIKHYGTAELRYMEMTTWMCTGGYDGFIDYFLSQELSDNVIKNIVVPFFENIASNHPNLIGKYISHPKFANYLLQIIDVATNNANLAYFLQNSDIDFQNIYFNRHRNEFYLDLYHRSIMKNEDFIKLLQNTKEISLDVFTKVFCHLACYKPEQAKIWFRYPNFAAQASQCAISRYKLVNEMIQANKFDEEILDLVYSLPLLAKFNPRISPFHIIHSKTVNKTYIACLQREKNKNLRDYASKTCLHYLIAHEKYSAAEKILKEVKDIDPNAKNSKGVSPLILATIHFRDNDQKLLDLITLMIDVGGNPNLKTAKGVSALDIARNTRRKTALIPLFENAVKK